jgi:hypothetical protein
MPAMIAFVPSKCGGQTPLAKVTRSKDGAGVISHSHSRAAGGNW